MTCPDARLEEYLDGELEERGRAEVESHLAGCGPCRAEMDGLRRLEGLLAAPPGGALPDADRFVSRVRSRTRRTGGWVLAAAAAFLVALGATLIATREAPVDVQAELVNYTAKPSSVIEGRIRKTAGWQAKLEASLDDRDVRVQFAAAALLFKLADDSTRDRVLARFQQKGPVNGGWTLAEIGAEDEDVELVPVALSVAGDERWAMDVLRRLQRLNQAAQLKIVESVVTLLMTDNPRVQKLALDIVRELDIEFPLTAIVDLLDSPELGDPALKILREATLKDFGKDKRAWRKALAPKEEER